MTEHNEDTEALNAILADTDQHVLEALEASVDVPARLADLYQKVGLTPDTDETETVEHVMFDTDMGIWGARYL